MTWTWFSCAMSLTLQLASTDVFWLILGANLAVAYLVDIHVACERGLIRTSVSGQIGSLAVRN